MSAADDKFKRVRYLRMLEKVAKSAINGLKRDDFEQEAFAQRTAKNIELLSKIEPVYLDQPYAKALENFINLLASNISREELLKSANALDKLKNSKNYKKEKHKNKFKDEH
ncbi:MAG: hypothetical protein LUC34_06065 [Campylobacter sp.]|nr:hypothetical protein [Campylobacter sp.]